MNWSALTKKQKQMIVATIFAAVAQVVLLLHFLGLTKPAEARGGSAKKDMTQFEQKLESAREILKRETEIRRGLAQSIKELEALTVYAPKFSDRYAWAYEYVSRRSTLSQVEVDSLEEVNFVVVDRKGAAKKGAAKAAVKESGIALPYEIKVSTRCGYNRLVEFLWRLEKGNPLLRIKEITISALPDSLLHQVTIIMQWPSSVKIEGGAP